MHAIIREFSNSFSCLKIRQSNGTLVKVSIDENNDVTYSARTPTGEVVKGVNRDGLNKILGYLEALDDGKRAELYAELTGILQAKFDQLVLEINLTTEGKKYAASYLNQNTDRLVHIEADNVQELAGEVPGYLQP